MELLMRKVCNEEELKSFVCHFDGDISGENGLDYTSEEAKENGFTSDIEFFISKAIHKHGHDFGKIVKSVMFDVWGTYDDDNYSFSDFEILTVDDGVVVSFVYASR